MAVLTDNELAGRAASKILELERIKRNLLAEFHNAYSIKNKDSAQFDHLENLDKKIAIVTLVLDTFELCANFQYEDVDLKIMLEYDNHITQKLDEYENHLKSIPDLFKKLKVNETCQSN